MIDPMSDYTFQEPDEVEFRNHNYGHLSWGQKKERVSYRDVLFTPQNNIKCI